MQNEQHSRAITLRPVLKPFLRYNPKNVHGHISQYKLDLNYCYLPNTNCNQQFILFFLHKSC